MFMVNDNLQELRGMLGGNIVTFFYSARTQTL